jgi:hypothetical protein
VYEVIEDHSRVFVKKIHHMKVIVTQETLNIVKGLTFEVSPFGFLRLRKLQNLGEVVLGTYYVFCRPLIALI